MTVTVLNTKTGGVENKFPDHDKYNITSEFDKFSPNFRNKHVIPG